MGDVAAIVSIELTNMAAAHVDAVRIRLEVMPFLLNMPAWSTGVAPLRGSACRGSRGSTTFDRPSTKTFVRDEARVYRDESGLGAVTILSDRLTTRPDMSVPAAARENVCVS